MPYHPKRPLLDPAYRGKGLFRSLIAGEGRTLTEAFAYLADRTPFAQVYRHPRRPLLAARIDLAPDEGRGYWNFAQIDNEVYVVSGRLAYHDQRVEFVAGDGLLQFYFTLSGDLTMAVSRTQQFRINRPSLFVYCQPKGLVIKEWTPPGAHERFVAVVLRPQYLIDHYLGSASEAPPGLDKFLNGAGGAFQHFQLPLNAQLFEIAARVIDHPLRGSVGLAYTEAVVAELLCCALDSLRTVAPQDSHDYTDRDLRCLHAARRFLTSQLTPAPSIRQVARAAGINETTLKRGFKAVFGETMFEFSVRCRMQQALALLRDHEMQVARVAGAVGYRHQTSFATAFRRHFGLSPKDVRRAKVA